LTIVARQRRIEANVTREVEMAYYLVQAAYTAAAWATLVSNPQDRTTPVRTMVENAGGTLESFYLTFGDFDVVAIVELPDAVAAAAVSIATSAGGGIKAIKTTPLITTDDAVRALTKAQTIGYEPPAMASDLQTPMHAG
jgi:uncharacterized protein with GYD domain